MNNFEVKLLRLFKDSKLYNQLIKNGGGKFLNDRMIESINRINNMFTGECPKAQFFQFRSGFTYIEYFTTICDKEKSVDRCLQLIKRKSFVIPIIYNRFNINDEILVEINCFDVDNAILLDETMSILCNLNKYKTYDVTDRDVKNISKIFNKYLNELSEEKT